MIGSGATSRLWMCSRTRRSLTAESSASTRSRSWSAVMVMVRLATSRSFRERQVAPEEELADLDLAVNKTVREEHVDAVTTRVLKADLNRVSDLFPCAILDRDVREQRHSVGLAAVSQLPQRRNQETGDLCRWRLLAAVIDVDVADLAERVHRDTKGEELAVLPQESLGEPDPVVHEELDLLLRRHKLSGTPLSMDTK